MLQWPPPAERPGGGINTSISPRAGRGEQSPPAEARTLQGRPPEEREALPPAQPHVPLCSAEKLGLLLSYIYLNVKSSA